MSCICAWSNFFKRVYNAWHNLPEHKSSLSLFSFLPVLRLELAFVTVKLRRNATFLLLMTPPTVLCLVKLSTFSTLVKAYFGFLIESLRIRIRNNLIGVRSRILLLHQLKHHKSRELLWNEIEKRNVNKRKSYAALETLIG